MNIPKTRWPKRIGFFMRSKECENRLNGKSKNKRKKMNKRRLEKETLLVR